MIDTLRIFPVDDMRHINLLQWGDCEFVGDRLSNAPHSHGYEVCYVYDGRGTQIHGETIVNADKDDIFLAEAGVEHTVNAFDSGYMRVYYFVFSLNCPSTDGSEAGVVSSFLQHHTLHAQGQRCLRPFMDQISSFEALGPQARPWVESTASLFLLAALKSLTSHLRKTPSTLHPAVDKALAFIREHASTAPDLSSIARSAGTSPRNLQLLFKRHLNQTVIEVLNKERCRLASHYLDMGFRAADIGPIIGIDDPCQFSRFYKRYTGATPSAYRPTHRSPGPL